MSKRRTITDLLKLRAQIELESKLNWEKLEELHDELWPESRTREGQRLKYGISKNVVGIDPHDKSPYVVHFTTTLHARKTVRCFSVYNYTGVDDPRFWAYANKNDSTKIDDLSQIEISLDRGLER